MCGAPAPGKEASMAEWISANWATIAALVFVAALIGIAVFSMIRNKRKGRTSCGCGCSACPMAGECGGKKKKA